MIRDFHTPQGIINIDPMTITDQEWLDLGYDLQNLRELQKEDTLVIEMNDTSHTIKDGYEDWQNLNSSEKDEVLRLVVKYVAWKEGLL